jgi:hypothetical protein
MSNLEKKRKVDEILKEKCKKNNKSINTKILSFFVFFYNYNYHYIKHLK